MRGGESRFSAGRAPNAGVAGEGFGFATGAEGRAILNGASGLERGSVVVVLGGAVVVGAAMVVAGVRLIWCGGESTTRRFGDPSRAFGSAWSTASNVSQNNQLPRPRGEHRAYA